MQKAYAKINWENYPSEETPINERNLNKIDAGLDEIDNRVITMDTTKLDKTTAASMVKDVTFNEETGIFTVTYLNGATATINTKIERLAINWTYDKEAQQLIITLDDGTEQTVDLSALITEYEFVDSDTIAFSIGPDGKISAIVKEASITEDMLKPNFLANVKVEVAKAEASAKNASASEINAKTSETASAASEANAKTYMDTASDKASEASTAASNAATSESNAKASAATATDNANSAKTYASNASASATSASNSATQAGNSATTATTKATAAANLATSADASAKTAQSYAVGGTGTRTGEDADNAKYYYEQTKQVSQSLNGIIPQGTVAFANLPTSGMEYGHMYNVSDAFVSDERFNDGGGVYYGPGNNVIWISGDLWDVTAGSSVTGVKGANQSTYQQGNVSLSAEDVGAVATGGDTAQNTVAFTSADNASPTAWTDVSLLKSGEKHSSILNKISNMFKNIRWLYKTLGTADISAIGDGTVKGAIATQNSNFAKQSEDISELNNALGDTSTLTEYEDVSTYLNKLLSNEKTVDAYIFGGRGINTNATLANGEFGCHRYSKLTASNSPSGTDTEGLLLVIPAIYSQTVIFQIFFGYQSQQIHARMCWYGTYMNWVKISN